MMNREFAEIEFAEMLSALAAEQVEHLVVGA
jgi:hypothetical protein